MIIAGPCLYTHAALKPEIVDTCKGLKGIADVFRCKLWGGGTTPNKYREGIGNSGILDLYDLQKNIMPCATEIQTDRQMFDIEDLEYLWIGARNSQNYGLLEMLKWYYGQVMIKRGFGMTIDETIGLFDIMRDRHGRNSYIIERGISTFDRMPDSRWSPDLKGMIQIKVERPDIFDYIVIDCSHSVGRAKYIGDTYRAFKSIGVKHFMFEVWANVDKAQTDQGQAISIKELEVILK